MCILFMSRKRIRKMQDELSELHIRVRQAQENERTLNDKIEDLNGECKTKDNTIGELSDKLIRSLKRIEMQRQVIDKLNNGQFKPRYLAQRRDDHDPYPEE